MDSMAKNWRFYEKKMNEEFEGGDKEKALLYKETYIALYKVECVDKVLSDLEDRISDLEESKKELGVHGEIERLNSKLNSRATSAHVGKLSERISKLESQVPKKVKSRINFRWIWDNIKPAYFIKKK